MMGSRSPDSEPTTRTLLQRLLKAAEPRTPRPTRSARTRAQTALLETSSSRRHSRITNTPARRSSQRLRSKSVGKVLHVQTSGRLNEQTPRTLLENILLTAPESSMIKPKPVLRPEPELQTVQPSGRESSPGSLELQLPELEPVTTVAPRLLVSRRRQQKLRLSVFEQGMDQGLLPPSQGSHRNADTSAGNSSASLTFATPVQPQSLRRPGLARRPLTRRAVDIGAFLQDLQDTITASVPPGDMKTVAAPLPTDTVLEDTQPFSQPLAGYSLSHRSLPFISHTTSEDAERPISHRTWRSRLQQDSLEKPAQHLAGQREEAENALGKGYLNISHSILTENGIEPLQNGVLEEAVERMEESFVGSKGKETTMDQGSIKAEEPERMTEKTETNESHGDLEALEQEGSSGDEDTSGNPKLATNVPEFLQTSKPPLPFEPAPSPTTAVLPSEPAKLPSPARIHRPRPRTTCPRPRQDPYKSGLSHYAKFFSFYAKMPMEKKALEMVEKCLDKYFQHLCDDLGVFAAHAGRKTVKQEDLELLMRRQGLVTDQVSLHVFVERHLPLEYRQLLIPCAFGDNSVFPAQ
ncbi:centromere protein T [Suncus etruscus]|uniref:centromere protein T n=1 Tax=Suncus etruscus TaxID=109475 RepID=UPI002110DCF0|nr:centromere protein T [Suncus etruscus]